MEKKAKSPFATELRALLDDTGALRRGEWAEVLGVSEAAISQWVNDASLPRPDNLRAIVMTLVADRRVPAHAIERFEAFAREPAAALSPHGERLGPTVAHYMLKPVRDGFLRTLDTMPVELAEQVLVEAAARCRQLRAVPPPARSVTDRRHAGFEDLVAAAVEDASPIAAGSGEQPVPMAAAARARRPSAERASTREGLRSALRDARATGLEVGPS
jgi:hypothetical protein